MAAAHTITGSDGTPLQVTDDGEGSPVVLLHGLACDGSMFDAVRAELREHRRVLVMDLRGHGKSQPVEGGFTLAEQADDIWALIEQLDLHDVTLVGHSAGGYAALAFAATYADLANKRVAAVLTVGTSASLQQIRERFVLRFSTTRLFYALMRNKVIGRSVVRVGGFGRRPDAALVEHTRQMALSCSRSVKLAWVKAIVGTSLQPDIVDLATPLHFATGSRDSTVTPKRLRALAALTGGGVTAIEGAGHMAPLERPRDVAHLIAGVAVTKASDERP